MIKLLLCNFFTQAWGCKGGQQNLRFLEVNQNGREVGFGFRWNKAENLRWTFGARGGPVSLFSQVRLGRGVVTYGACGSRPAPSRRGLTQQQCPSESQRPFLQRSGLRPLQRRGPWSVCRGRGGAARAFLRLCRGATRHGSHLPGPAIHKALPIARQCGALVLGKEMVVCQALVCDCRLGSQRRDGNPR